MNKKTPAELAQSRERVHAQLASVAALLRKTRMSGADLQRLLNKRLASSKRRNADDASEIKSESYFAKKLRGDRGGFRGEINSHLCELCIEQKIKWPKGEHFAKLLKLAHRAKKRGPNEESDIAGEEFFRGKENRAIYKELKAAVGHAIKHGRVLQLNDWFGWGMPSEMNTQELAEVQAAVALRDKLFQCIEAALKIPYRHREYFALDEDPSDEISKDPFYRWQRSKKKLTRKASTSKKVAKK